MYYPTQTQYRMKVERTASGGRRLRVPKRGGLAVQIPRSMRHQLVLLPIGTSLEVECLQIDDDELQAQSIRKKGVQLPSAVVAATARWDRDEPGPALTALRAEGYPIEQDPHRLGWRIRFEIELEQEEAVSRDLRLLLTLDDELDTRGEPPGLLDLYRSLSPELQEKLAPAVAHRVPRFNYQSPDVSRLLDMIPIDLWPCGYLAYRLKTEVLGAATPGWIREARERLEQPGLEQDDKTRLEKALTINSKEADGLRRKQNQRKNARQPIHPILRKALSTAPKQARPQPPHHAGGPPPVLMGAQRYDLEQWIAAETLQRTGRNPAEIAAGERPLRRDMTKAVVTHAVQLLAAKEPDDAIRAFLLDLDQAMMRIELHFRLERAQDSPVMQTTAGRLESSMPRILFRGADGSGRVQAWLLGIDGGHALLCQVKGAWIWVEGTSDEVVASMPDQWFEGAAGALADLA